MRKFLSNNEAFTGLEAAIVLTAFIVVAAVFAYVVLGSGFFTTEKAKEVIHTGVDTATSSLELAGDVIGHGWEYNESATSYYYNQSLNTSQPSYWYTNPTNALDSTNLTVVEFFVQLTAGQNPIDLDNLVVAYTDVDIYNGSLVYSNRTNADKGNLSMGNWNYTVINGDTDNLLEFAEKAKIIVALPEYGVTVNKEFAIEVKPASGAVLPITKTAPPALDKTMRLF